MKIPRLPARTAPLLLAAIVAAGGLARFARLDHGLPGLVHADAFKFVGEAARMVATGELHPADLQHPGLLTNLLAAVYAVADVTSERGQHLTGHFIAALAGSLLVLATWLLARRVCGPRAALLPAALSAVCPALLSSSRIPAPDILLALFTTLCLALLVREPARLRYFALAGLCVGLAVGAKFAGLLLLPWIPAGALLTAGSAPEALRRTAWGAAGAAAGFLATTPWFPALARHYIAGLWIEAQVQRFGQIGRVQGGFFDYLISMTPTWEQPWLGTSMLVNLGAAALLAALAAIAAGLSGRGGRRVAFLAAFAAFFLIVVSGPGRLKAYRFLLPLLPVLHVLIGWLVESVLLPRLRRGRTAALLIAAVLLAALPAWRSGRYLAATGQPSSNDVAHEWVSANIPPGSKVFVAPIFTPELRKLPLEIVNLRDPARRQYRLPPGVGPSAERDPVYHADLIGQFRDLGVEWVILNSYFDGAFAPVPENRRFFPRSVREREEFLEGLREAGTLAHEVAGWEGGRIGPRITVYRLGTARPGEGG